MILARTSVAFCLLVLAASLPGQRRITTPEAYLGHQVGADHFLASYTQLRGYWEKLADESDRMVLEEIGTSSYGQPMVMAVISSPENLARRERLRGIAQRMCLAEGLTDVSARGLAREGRAVVWIDAGLHASESVAAQNILELVYRMNTQTDPEVERILDKVILLVCPVNPDGMEMIANAYMATRAVGRIPVLYQRYVGHDNNRDFYMSSMPETEAVNRVLYRRWYPQIVYNHHQTAPRGTIIFTPPFRDPFNYHIDPQVVRGIELVSAHMNARFAAEGKPGVISRSGASYSTWWNGGLRTTAYFHNMIGILTESFGSPDPTEIEQRLSQRLPYHDYPMPVPSQTWHARQTIEYLQTANFAILDLASRFSEELLFNIYAMGRDAIERGSRDHWTPTPRLVAEAERREAEAREVTAESGGETGGEAADETEEPAPVEDVFADASLRDARGYIVPSVQPDPTAARRFIDALQKAGVAVHRATDDFEVQGVRYPVGSWVVFAAQAFRAHVVDMFEPQWHPDDIGAGGEPVRPYDSAGWTPALSMDVRFDRILDGFDGPLQQLDGPARTRPGRVTRGSAGYVMSHADSASYLATNRLLAAGDQVLWLRQPWRFGSKTHPAGTVFVPAGAGTDDRVAELARELGLDFTGVDAAPVVSTLRLAAPRVGLFDVFGGNMPTGWTEWTLQRHGFAVEPVFGARIHEAKLRDDFDVLIFHTGLPFPAGDGKRVQRALQRGRPSRVSADDVEKLAAALPPFEDWSSIAERRVRLDGEKAVPALRAFVEDGGVLIAMGSQANAVIQHFELPVTEGTFLTDGEDGERRRTRRSEFFIPTSLVRARVDAGHVLGFGVSPELAMVFQRSPVYEVDEAAEGIEVVARYASGDVLMSGWALGAEHIHDKAAVLAVPMGKGVVYLYGAEVNFRGQPDGSIKMLLNGILGGSARAETVR